MSFQATTVADSFLLSLHANWKSPCTYSYSPHSCETEILAAVCLIFFFFPFHSAPTFILTQRWTDYILAATGLLWLHILPDACDIPGMFWGNFLKYNQNFPPQSSYGVRRSHRTWGPGLLLLPGLRNSWHARWAMRQWVTNCFRTSCWYHADCDFPTVCLSCGWSADLRSPPRLSESGPFISNNKRPSSPLPLPSALQTGTKTAAQPHWYYTTICSSSPH